jgi:hypothetical protein
VSPLQGSSVGTITVAGGATGGSTQLPVSGVPPGQYQFDAKLSGQTLTATLTVN